VPQPTTELVHSSAEFASERPYPFLVKTAFSTASAGAWRVDDVRDRDALRRKLEDCGAFNNGLIVQARVAGALERNQTVFNRGRLIASHAYRQIAAGPRGGDVLKTSVERPDARTLAQRIGVALGWHGALSVDYILEESTGRPMFIDFNPRLVEPMNAWFSDTDPSGRAVGDSLGQTPPWAAPGWELTTSLGLMGLLDAAGRRGRRRDVLQEIGLLLVAPAGTAARWRNSARWVLIPGVCCPLAALGASLLLSPASAARFSDHAVKTYSLTPEAIHQLRGWALGGQTSGGWP